MPGSGQGVGEETAQVAVERAREGVGLQEADDLLDDRAEVLLLDQQPAFEPVEEQERVPDVVQGLRPAAREPAEVVGPLVGVIAAYCG